MSRSVTSADIDLLNRKILQQGLELRQNGERITRLEAQVSALQQPRAAAGPFGLPIPPITGEEVAGMPAFGAKSLAPSEHGTLQPVVGAEYSGPVENSSPCVSDSGSSACDAGGSSGGE